MDLPVIRIHQKAKLLPRHQLREKAQTVWRRLLPPPRHHWGLRPQLPAVGSASGIVRGASPRPLRLPPKRGLVLVRLTHPQLLEVLTILQLPDCFCIFVITPDGLLLLHWCDTCSSSVYTVARDDNLYSMCNWSFLCTMICCIRLMCMWIHWTICIDVPKKFKRAFGFWIKTSRPSVEAELAKELNASSVPVSAVCCVLMSVLSVLICSDLFFVFCWIFLLSVTLLLVMCTFAVVRIWIYCSTLVHHS